MKSTDGGRGSCTRCARVWGSGGRGAGRGARGAGRGARGAGRGARGRGSLRAPDVQPRADARRGIAYDLVVVTHNAAPRGVLFARHRAVSDGLEETRAGGRKVGAGQRHKLAARVVGVARARARDSDDRGPLVGEGRDLARLAVDDDFEDELVAHALNQRAVDLVVVTHDAAKALAARRGVARGELVARGTVRHAVDRVAGLGAEVGAPDLDPLTAVRDGAIGVGRPLRVVAAQLRRGVRDVGIKHVRRLAAHEELPRVVLAHSLRAGALDGRVSDNRVAVRRLVHVCVGAAIPKHHRLGGGWRW